MSANATIIGRIAVKVLPDTGDFRRDLERKLEAIEKRVEINIPAKLDEIGLKRSILDGVRKVNTEIRNHDAYKVKLSTTLDISSRRMREDINRIVRKYEELSKTNKVKLFTDLAWSDIRREVREAAKEAQAQAKSDKVQLKLNLKTDLDNLDNDLRRAKHQLDQFQHDESPLDISIKTDVNAVAQRASQAKLALLARPRTVELLPRVSKVAAAKAAATLAALSGARTIHKYFDDLWQSIKNLDKAAPLIGSIALAVAGLAGWGATAAANLFALSASLAQIGGATLALPGILAGVGTGLFITINAFKDLKKALPDVYDHWQKVRHEITKDFWSEASDGIRQLASVYLPHLGDAAKQVGQFWGVFAQKLSKPFQTALGPMFANLTESIKISTDNADVFAGIITKLGLTGAQYLPRLAQWFVDISTKFNDFLERARNDGTLKRWIDTGIEQLHQLGQVFKNLFTIFDGLSKAMTNAGGSTLTIFADTLKKISDTVNSDGFQKGLTGFFKAAFDAMHNIAATAGPAFKKLLITLGKTMESILPIAGKVIGTLGKALSQALASPAIQNGLKALVDGLSKGFTAFAPAIKAIAPVIGHLGKVLGDFLAKLGPLFAAAFEALAPIFDALLTAAQPIIDSLMPTLTRLIKKLAPIVLQLVDAFLAFINPIVKQLAPILKVLLPPLVQILKIFADLAAQIMPTLGKQLALLLPPLAQLVTQFLQLFLQVLQPMMPAIVSLVNDALPPLVKLFIDLTNALAPLQPLFNPLLASMTVMGQLVGPLTPLLVGLSKAIGGIATALDWCLRQMQRFGKLALQVLSVPLKALVALFGGELKILKSLWGAEWGALVGIASRLFNPIKPYVSAALGAVKSLVSDGLGAIKSKTSEIWGEIESIWKASVASIKSIFSSAFDGVIHLIGASIRTVLGMFKDLPSLIVGALGDLSHILIDAGKSLISGFIGGIKSKIGGVKDTLGGLTHKLTSWKGPPEKDKVLLFHAGQLIIAGLIKGLESKYDDVRSSLTDLTQQIKLITDTKLRAVLQAQAGHLRGLLRDWNRTASQLQAAKDKLSALADEAQQYRDSIRSSLVSEGDITGFEQTTFKGIVKSLREAVEKAKHFADLLARLKKLGLNQTALDQIAQAGAENGTAAAQAIADAGKAGIKQINRLDAQLNDAAGKAAKTAADAMYQNGLNMAKGLVKGLKEQEANIEKTMTKIAKKMVDIIKSELGIHSPSRVFEQLGKHTGKGFLNGLESMYDIVHASLRSFGKELGSTTLSAPQLSAATRSIANGSASAGSKVFNYYAAPGSSLGSEEDLFAATKRPRFGW